MYSLRARVESVARAVCPSSSPGILDAAVDDVLRLIGAMDGPAKAVVGAGSLLAHSGRSWAPARLLEQLVLLAYFEQDAVRARVGYAPDPFVASVAAARQTRWADDIAAHRALLLAPAPLRPRLRRSSTRGAVRSGRELPGAAVECDVVVVGSGAGGAVVAAELAEAGLSVAVLEEGGHHPTSEFTTSTTDMLRLLYRNAGATVTLGRRPIGYAEGRCVGGSTVVNGAMAFRASERVLDRWAHQTGIPELQHTALARHYERVERFCSVGRQDPGSAGRDQELLRLGAQRLGWKIVENTRAQVHCGGCNVCVWGCPTGAKQSTLVSYLPRAVEFGADVWADCWVQRIRFHGGRALGVCGRVRDGARSVPFRVNARAVVIAAGAIGTPGLLWRSGVRSSSGQLGRNLAVHPGTQVTAVFDEDVHGWKGAHQTIQVRQFESKGIILAAVNLPPSLVAMSLNLRGQPLAAEMDEYNRMVTAGVLVEDTGTGRVRTFGRGWNLPVYSANDQDAHRVLQAVESLCELLLEAGARRIHLPIPGVPPLEADQVRQYFREPSRPGDPVLSTVHLMGTARLGSDPRWAVCDPVGGVYGRSDLYVADASLFPGPVGVNPMLTIMALATRVAGGILDQW